MIGRDLKFHSFYR